MLASLSHLLRVVPRLPLAEVPRYIKSNSLRSRKLTRCKRFEYKFYYTVSDVILCSVLSRFVEGQQSHDNTVLTAITVFSEVIVALAHS